mmetsp:Transcript_35279/g.88475  ORF Transcript_35279/g.88475 Transcript_35279/m.88475 type:complete len:342 (+) Transcript_35279:55-1080(+)
MGGRTLVACLGDARSRSRPPDQPSTAFAVSVILPAVVVMDWLCLLECRVLATARQGRPLPAPLPGGEDVAGCPGRGAARWLDKHEARADIVKVVVRQVVVVFAPAALGEAVLLQGLEGCGEVRVRLRVEGAVAQVGDCEGDRVLPRHDVPHPSLAARVHQRVELEAGDHEDAQAVAVQRVLKRRQRVVHMPETGCGDRGVWGARPLQGQQLHPAGVLFSGFADLVGGHHVHRFYGQQPPAARGDAPQQHHLHQFGVVRGRAAEAVGDMRQLDGGAAVGAGVRGGVHPQRPGDIPLQRLLERHAGQALYDGGYEKVGVVGVFEIQSRRRKHGQSHHLGNARG